MALMSEDEITERLQDLAGWTHSAGAIHKTFTFRDFPEAVLFVSALVPGAEDADHHPDITIHYKRVTISYATHSEGGITDKDFAGATMAEAVAVEMPHLTDFAEG